MSQNFVQVKFLDDENINKLKYPDPTVCFEDKYN